MSVFRNDARSSIAFRHGDLLFELDVVPAVSFAFHHCRIPVINSIDVINQGTSPSRQFALILDIPGYALPLSLPVDALEPETATRIAPIPLELRYERLQGLEARRYAALTAAIDDYPVFRDEILVLGVYEWSLVASARKTLACYVQPGHAVVQQILADAHEMATGRATMRRLRNMPTMHEPSHTRSVGSMKRFGLVTICATWERLRATR
jgi:hypothetical protein